MAWPSTGSRAVRWRFGLRVTYAGRDWYFADVEISPSSTSGGVVAHYGGLSVGGYSESFEALADRIDRQSTSVEVFWPTPIAPLIADGYRLDTAEAELYVLVDGLPFERRRSLVVGRVMEPRYGAGDEPVAFSVEAPPWLDSGTWPDLLTSPTSSESVSYNKATGSGSTKTITGNTVVADLLGKTAPHVVGSPGNVQKRQVTTTGTAFVDEASDIISACRPGAVTSAQIGTDNTGITIPSSASLYPAPSLLVLCGHATQAGAYGGDGTLAITSAFSGTPVDAPIAPLFDENGLYITALVPFHKTIAGRTCTVVNVNDFWANWFGVRHNVSADSVSVGNASGFSTNVATSDPSRPLPDRNSPIGFCFASAHSSFSTFYGAHSGRQAGPLRSIQDLLIHVLSSSAHPVDWPRLYAALDRIPVFDVEGYVDERVAVWEFVSRELLPLLPMSLRRGPKGLYALVADLGATVDDAIGTIRAGYDAERTSGVQYERRLSDLVGTIEVESGSYAGRPMDVLSVGSSMVQARRADLALRSSTADRALSAVQQAAGLTSTSVQTIKAPWLAPRQIPDFRASRAGGSAGAHYVAHQRLALRAAQVRTVSYRLAPEFVALEVGDLVRLVDPELSIDAPAYLSTLSMQDGQIEGTFSIYDPVQR